MVTPFLHPSNPNQKELRRLDAGRPVFKPTYFRTTFLWWFSRKLCYKVAKGDASSPVGVGTVIPDVSQYPSIFGQRVWAVVKWLPGRRIVKAYLRLLAQPQPLGDRSEGGVSRKQDASASGETGPFYQYDNEWGLCPCVLPHTKNFFQGFLLPIGNGTAA